MDNTGSHRKNVGHTYKGCDGFASIMSNLGIEGFLLHHELRTGTQHCQKNAPNFLKRNFNLLENLNSSHPVLVRMDAGNDSADTTEILRTSDHAFILKCNLRRDSPVRWLSHAIFQDKPEHTREGKYVHIGTLEHDKPGGKESECKPLSSVYQVTRHSIDKHG